MQTAPKRGSEFLQIALVIAVGSFFFFDIIGVFGMPFAIGGLVIAILCSIFLFRMTSIAEERHDS